MGPDTETKKISHEGIKDGNSIKEFVSKEALNCSGDDTETKEIYHEGRSSIKETEDKLMRSASNNNDHAVKVKSSFDAVNDGEDPRWDVDVNIIDCTNSCDNLHFEAGCQDTSENSSSFGGTISGFDDVATTYGDEVISELHGDTSSPSCDGFDLFRMRKKRVTSHWRSYRHPIAWRLKWLELQIKERESQAAKCDRLLKVYHEKWHELENFSSDDFAAKSLPYYSQSRRDKVMRRKKRKRVEDVTDAASYMSQHNLFSFYENRRHTADDAVDGEWLNLDKKVTELEGNDESVPLEPQHGDNFWENLLCKIRVAQSQVGKLKTRVHKVVSEKAELFTSGDNLSSLVAYNSLTSSAANPASPPNSGDRMRVGSSYIASQLLSEYNMGDLVMPGTAVLNHGEVIHHPDAIANTDHSQTGPSSSSTGHGIFIYKRRAKVELNDFEEVKVLPTDNFQSLNADQGSTVPTIPDLEPDLPIVDQPIPKLRSISKLTGPSNKRKRARRKAGRWNRRG